jgi:hypothetical protein
MAKKKRASRTKKPAKTTTHERVSVADAKLLSAIQEMSEEAFTKDVLRPLFHKLGYHKVEYNGGVYEEGKDLICLKKDEIGDLFVLVVQVKKTRASALASSGRSYSEIISQLEAAACEPVLLDDGREAYANGVWFVTPYPIDSRTRATRRRGTSELQKQNTKIVDGARVIELMREHLPELCLKCGVATIDWTSALKQDLSNDPLMRALESRSSRSLADFHTDIDFRLARDSCKTFFFGRFTPVVGDLLLTPEEWAELKSYATLVKEHVNVAIIKGDFEQIELENQGHIDAYTRMTREREQCEQALDVMDQSTKEHERQLLKLNERAKDAHAQKAEALVELDARLGIYNRKVAHANEVLESLAPDGDVPSRLRYMVKVRDSDLSEVQNISRNISAMKAWTPELIGEIYMLFQMLWDACDQARSSAKNQTGMVEEYAQNAKSILKRIRDRLASDGVGVVQFLKEIKHSPQYYTQLVDKVTKEMEEFLARVATLQKIPMSVAAPQIKVEIDGGFLVEWINNKQSQSLKAYERLAAGKLSCAEMADVLLQMNSIVLVTEGILRHRSREKVFNVLLADGESLASQQRLQYAVQRVFETGVNFLVVGEAGSGKTTSLQMYYKQLVAQKGQKLPLFVALGRLVRHWPATAEDSCRGLLDALCGFFRTRQVPLGHDDLQSLLEDTGAVLLLDAIDEATKHIPTLSHGIKSLAERFPKVQIITSSRLIGNTVNSIPFVTVALLRFTPLQQKEFFRLWFKDSPKMAEEVITHLDQNKQVAEIVTSPLLATIFCVLREHDVALPASEPELYEQRMKLLTGQYDVQKGIESRIRTRNKDLYLIARRLAFEMHESRQIEASFDDLKKRARRFCLREGLTHIDADQAVTELIDPCNVLVPTETEQFGFGHLRYQEFLVAELIVNDRSIEVEPFLYDEWWHDVFMLVARIAGNLDWLFTAAHDRMLGKKAIKTLQDMVEVVPPGKRNEARAMLASLKEEIMGR